MFHPMRKSNRALSEPEIKAILEQGEYGVLSTVGADGYPYGTPVSYVYAEGKIYFHCAKGVGHKLENIEYCSKVGFTVVGQTQVLPEKFSTKFESVIAFGAAKEAMDQKQFALEKLVDKYAPEEREAGAAYIREAFDQTAIYEIEISHLTGKARKNG